MMDKQEKESKKQIGEGEGDGWGCDGSKLTIHKLYLPGQGYFSTVTT